MKKPPIVKLLQVQWTGIFENYARKYVRKNLWRIKAALGSEEDAMQQAALVFARCVRSYEMRVDNPAWFMSLYKVALMNDFNSFAIVDGRIRNLVAPPDAELIEHETGSIYASLCQASVELQTVLSMIAKAPSEMLAILLHPADSEVMSRRLARWAGIKTRHNLVDELRDLLT